VIVSLSILALVKVTIPSTSLCRTTLPIPFWPLLTTKAQQVWMSAFTTSLLPCYWTLLTAYNQNDSIPLKMFTYTPITPATLFWALTHHNIGHNTQVQKTSSHPLCDKSESGNTLSGSGSWIRNVQFPALYTQHVETSLCYHLFELMSHRRMRF